MVVSSLNLCRAACCRQIAVLHLFEGEDFAIFAIEIRVSLK